MGRRLVTKTMRQALRILREEAPPLFPVRVRRRRLETIWGQCRFVERGKTRYFSISVESRVPEPLVVETLIHEWAHAIAWQLGKTVEDHGPEWGVAYARLYRLVVDSENMPQ